VHGRETGSVNQKEKRALRVFGNGVLMGIFGRGKLTKREGKPNNEASRNLYSLNTVKVTE
jgi:hypothetical protein